MSDLNDDMMSAGNPEDYNSEWARKQRLKAAWTVADKLHGTMPLREIKTILEALDIPDATDIQYLTGVPTGMMRAGIAPGIAGSGAAWKA